MLFVLIGKLVKEYSTHDDDVMILRVSSQLSRVPRVQRTAEMHGRWMHDWILLQRRLLHT